MNEFIEIFGDMKVAAVVMIIAAIVFLWKIYKVVEKHFRKKYDAEAQRAAQMHDILEQVKKYPEWRRQSIEYQKKYAEEAKACQKRRITRPSAVQFPILYKFRKESPAGMVRDGI